MTRCSWAWGWRASTRCRSRARSWRASRTPSPISRELRQAKDQGALPVGRKVVVIGGGNTAIDIAVQSKRLGAEDVTIVYRRGPGQMSATPHEQEFAQTNGVKIKHWARPLRAWAGPAMAPSRG